ncbi:MAG: epoxyqueuosine reductase QueH [Prevotella sp.]
MKDVLLHCCCAPCSSAIIEWMMSNGIRPTLYFCNPNIYPEREYLIRKQELMRYASRLALRVIDDESQPGWSGWDNYHACWLESVMGMEEEPERGARCLLCFKLRLLSAARVAAREGIQVFTTTLASSRWKSIAQITEAGEWAAEKAGGGVVFDSRNWRKGGLQQRRNELLRENGFYNQQYCGCEFSLRQTQRRMAERDKNEATQDDATASGTTCSSRGL